MSKASLEVMKLDTQESVKSIFSTIYVTATFLLTDNRVPLHNILVGSICSYLKSSTKIQSLIASFLFAKCITVLDSSLHGLLKDE